MSRNISKENRGNSKVPEWLEKAAQDAASEEQQEQFEEDMEEEVVDHTPSRRKKKQGWAYTTKEGGDIHSLNLPTTDKKIKEVEQQLLNPRNWRRYKRHPAGGHRNYTQVNCFPPFDFLRLAELYMPDGRVWKSRTRQFHESEDNKQ